MTDLIRVTTALSPFTGYGQIDPVVLQRAADRGTRVHEAINGFLQGHGMWPELEEDAGYLDSMQRFWEKDFPIVCHEKRFDDQELGITGACDLIIQTDEGNVLLDWKTSSKENRTWHLQGSAYAHLARLHGFTVDHIWFVKLSKVGGKPKIFKYSEDFPEFLTLLNVYKKYFKDNKIEVNYE